MSGAYVAKPSAVAPAPVVPPDWNLNWTFPGPSPPGYEPAYSLNITAPASSPYDDPLSASVTLFDHESYETDDPDAGSALTWTATVDGQARLLRFAGVGSYAASVNSSYVETDGFWGAVASLDVQLTSEDNGKTLVLQVSSAPKGGTVVGTRNIAIGLTGDLVISITVGSAGLCVYGVEIAVGEESLATVEGMVVAGEHTGPTVENNVPDEIDADSTATGATFTFLEFRESVYSINFDFYGADSDSAISVVLTINGTEYTLVKAGTSGDFNEFRHPWLTFDGATGEVTVVNP
jgi:hypothetical protein